MAAVTVNSKHETVWGDLWVRIYNIDIATTGDTLQTDLNKVLAAHSNTPAEITKIVPTAGSLAFTISGATTGALVTVIGES